ncbi:MAG: redoxin family protein [Armatimonadetes bacterium]|nr:redoxin family protein [Armatimonadota bacterium]
MRQTLSLAILAALISGAHAQDMTIGDRAPKLDVAKWVKGKPVKEFKAGRLYVVEFWATWCGPCRVSIPHITKLALKYKDKITFIGVDVWETPGGGTDTSYMDGVVQYVEDMGEKMDYNVAIDGPEGTMAKSWMEAAGRSRIHIPTAFIVNGDGVIAWIGHPMEMDETLGKVIAGTYDLEAAVEAFEKQRLQSAALDKLAQKLRVAYQSGGMGAMLPVLDEAMVEIPELKTYFQVEKLELLMQVDPAQVADLARELFESEMKDDAGFLNNIAWWMIERDKPPIKIDYKLALGMAERACELTKHEDPTYLDTLALAHFRNGNVKKAIEVQEKAIALLEKDEDVPEEMVEEFKSRLKKFKEKKGG